MQCFENFRGANAPHAPPWLRACPEPCRKKEIAACILVGLKHIVEVVPPGDGGS